MPDPIPERLFPVLVLGGTRSGKSRWAERLVQGAAADMAHPVCYLATAEPLDDEMSARIALHRARRPAAWVTHEEPVAVAEAIQHWGATHIVLVECLTLLMSNWLRGDPDDATLDERVETLARAVHASAKPVVVVSNQVGSGLVPMHPLARRYADWLGLMNQRMARGAARVYLTVAGRPLLLPPDPDGAP